MTSVSLFSKLKEFNRDNIIICEIKNAGHFPWIENPEDVSHLFNDFAKVL